MSQSPNAFGWFGWFSAAGFVILGLLYLLDAFVAEVWAFSTLWTLIIALVAGIGALALYFGEDPTA
jgi:hypothetical protein